MSRASPQHNLQTKRHTEGTGNTLCRSDSHIVAGSTHDKALMHGRDKESCKTRPGRRATAERVVVAEPVESGMPFAALHSGSMAGLYKGEDTLEWQGAGMGGNGDVDDGSWVELASKY